MSKIVLKNLSVFKTRQWFLDTAKEILEARKQTKVCLLRMFFFKYYYKRKFQAVADFIFIFCIFHHLYSGKLCNKGMGIVRIKCPNLLDHTSNLNDYISVR